MDLDFLSSLQTVYFSLRKNTFWSIYLPQYFAFKSKQMCIVVKENSECCVHQCHFVYLKYNLCFISQIFKKFCFSLHHQQYLHRPKVFATTTTNYDLCCSFRLEVIGIFTNVSCAINVITTHNIYYDTSYCHVQGQCVNCSQVLSAVVILVSTLNVVLFISSCAWANQALTVNAGL